MYSRYFKDVNLFDINRVNEISYIKYVATSKSFSSIFWSHFHRLFMPLFKRSSIKKAEILFYGVTINNQRSFSTILHDVKHTFYNLDNNEDPLISSYMLYSLIGLPYLVWLYFSSDEAHRRIIRSNRIVYLLSYGKLISTRRTLKKANPKVLVMANDHSPMNRCFLWNATIMGIKTVYTQHASVSNEFPPLSFDYTFLDGQMSFDMYGKNSKKGSFVFLAGPCRYDYMKEYLDGDREFVGISLNEMDDFNLVKNLCIFLSDKGCTKIKVRSHPSMGLWHFDWFVNNGIDFSQPSQETPGEYLSKLKLQISNVSGIHLDAVILKTPTVLFQLSTEPIDDVFHFLERGIVKSVLIEDIFSYIMAPSKAIPSESAVRYFVSSYQTNIEFSVGSFIASVLDTLIEAGFDNSIIIENIIRKFGEDIKFYAF